ncbi:MAG: hypothetical protein F6K31_26190 [Symploca sp. SIO2G7]|nr:hypothetical protein [Symploca sp. SIO2G7]
MNNQGEINIFLADFAAQQIAIEQAYGLLEQRAVNLSSNRPETLESTAYQLHNLYSAIEDLLKLIAAYFENNISDSSRWHSLLLRRMTQPVIDIRPAVLSSQSYQDLNDLRGFRHFFRHAYGVEIDEAQLQSNLSKARRLKSQLKKDLTAFANVIQTIK